MGILGSDAPHHLDPRRYGNAVAFRVARRLGRRTVTAAGCWGRVTGHADDDVMLRHYGRCGTWSAATVGAMTAAVHAAPDRPWRLVDVGAAIGLVTLGVLRQVSVAADLVEPDAANFALLRRNMARLAPGADLTFHPCALGDPAEAGARVVPERMPGNGGDVRMRPAAPGEEGVPLCRLDDLVTAADGEAVIVKIDTQGAEVDVVAGGPHLLARARLVVIEFWPHGLRATGHDPMAFADGLLDRARAAALIADEHRAQVPAWGTPAALRDRLERLAHDGGASDQVELLLTPAGSSA